jgi:hypothetical protein
MRFHSLAVFRTAFLVSVLLAWGWLGSSIRADDLQPQRMQDPIVLNDQGINQLFAPDAQRSRDLTEFGPMSNFGLKRFWIDNWSKASQVIAWDVTTPEAGDYFVTFLLNADAGREITVKGAGTDLVFTTPTAGWQRSEAPTRLSLPAGRSTLTLQINDGAKVELKAMELVNVKDRENLAKRIAAFRGDTSWMKTAGYGIMVQLGGWSYPPHGDKKPWPGFAEDFNAADFVQKIDEMGGKYLVWSATWWDYLYPAPIQSIADILPQRVSNRDLIGDLIAECQKRHIKFMLYYHIGHDNPEVLTAKGLKDPCWSDYQARQNWLDREEQIFAEVGNRYGSGLAGVFIDDGCCWYPADFEKLGAALKAGNPKRIIAYNPWVAASYTPFQDFYCGENFDGGSTPYPLSDGVASSGPQAGLQLFGTFIFDGPDWGVHSPNQVIDDPASHGWSVNKVVELSRRLQGEHYSVAFNLIAYEDGSFGDASYTMLKNAAQILNSK